MRATNACANETRSRPRGSSPHRLLPRRIVRPHDSPVKATRRVRRHILCHRTCNHSSKSSKTLGKTCIRHPLCRQSLRQSPPWKNLITPCYGAFHRSTRNPLESRPTNDSVRSNYTPWRPSITPPCRFIRTLRSHFCLHTIPLVKTPTSTQCYAPCPRMASVHMLSQGR